MPTPNGGGRLKNSCETVIPAPSVPVTESISCANVIVAAGPVITSVIPESIGPPGSSVWKRASLMKFACVSVVRKMTFFTLSCKKRSSLSRSAAYPSQRSYGSA